MDALGAWIERSDPGARIVPSIGTGYSDSRTFRAAFPDCVAYGFFPHRHMSLSETNALVHGRNERIDVRDLALAVDCYRSVRRRAARLIQSSQTISSTISAIPTPMPVIESGVRFSYQKPGFARSREMWPSGGSPVQSSSSQAPIRMLYPAVVAIHALASG